MNLKQALKDCKKHCDEGGVCGGECFTTGWEYAQYFGSEKTPLKKTSKVKAASRAHNKQKLPCLCPKCSSRDVFQSLLRSDLFGCWACKGTWQA